MKENSIYALQHYKKSPCSNCPYRVDAPLALWDIKEFENLLEKDKDYWGTVFACHKKDGHICVGFLMDQLKRNVPSIMVRLWMIKNKVAADYLDGLHCSSGTYDSVEQMCKANYPGRFRKSKL